MNRLWSWIALHWRFSGAQYQLSSQLEKTTRATRLLEKQRRSFNREFNRRAAELERRREELDQTQRDLEATLLQAKATEESYKESLEEANSRLRVLEQTTVPTLLANIQQFREMWEAETAIHTRRQALLPTSSSEDG